MLSNTDETGKKNLSGDSKKVWCIAVFVRNICREGIPAVIARRIVSVWFWSGLWDFISSQLFAKKERACIVKGSLCRFVVVMVEVVRAPRPPP